MEYKDHIMLLTSVWNQHPLHLAQAVYKFWGQKSITLVTVTKYNVLKTDLSRIFYYYSNLGVLRLL